MCKICQWQAKAAVLGVDRPYAGRVWTWIEEDLDTYAQAWVATHTEACEAAGRGGEESTAMLDARMGCLHQAAVALDATVAVLATADVGVVDKAHALLLSRVWYLIY